MGIPLVTPYPFSLRLGPEDLAPRYRTLHAEHVPTWSVLQGSPSPGLSCAAWALLELPSPVSSHYTRPGLPLPQGLKVKETLWLPRVLTHGSDASLCVCICVLLVFFFQMTKSVTNPEELGGLASQMTTDYGHLALQGQMAAATAEPEEVCHLKAPILRSKHLVLIPGGGRGGDPGA